MKDLELKQIVELNDIELNEIEGGSIFTAITKTIGFLAGMNGKRYLSMHESGTLAYMH